MEFLAKASRRCILPSLWVGGGEGWGMSRRWGGLFVGKRSDILPSELPCTVSSYRSPPLRGNVPRPMTGQRIRLQLAAATPVSNDIWSLFRTSRSAALELSIFNLITFRRYYQVMSRNPNASQRPVTTQHSNNYHIFASSALSE